MAWRKCFAVWVFGLTGLCAFQVALAGAGPRTVFTFDARTLNRLDLGQSANAETVWDTMHALGALQGLANRHSPQLYLFYCSEFGVDTDQFWFNWLRNEDGWLKRAQVIPLSDLDEVVTRFRRSFEGLVVYDPMVYATANLASTAAGCENLLPVRYDARAGTVYDRLVNRLKIPVKLWLVNPDGSSRFTAKGCIPDSERSSTGSAKADAYLWALQRYVDSGRCARGIAAYYLDSFWQKHPRRAGPTMHTLSNHDYFVANRAFFFDLSPWGDELPTDDPGQEQGVDRRAFLEVMHALYKRSGGGIIKVGGFTPWPYKYTSHASPPGKHDGVPTEWEFGRLISQFNGYMEADAAGLSAMANASFFRHYPLKSKYRQPNAKPGLREWRARGYISEDGKVQPKLYLGHYVGDYDAPSWLYKAVAAFFPDRSRGSVPLGWAFDPNLADRVPHVLAYAYRNATTNDFFITGDSGAGYLNPRALSVRPDSRLDSGLGAWTAHCRTYYKRWGMSITGFMLDGAAGASKETEFRAYRTFSPDGVGTHFEKGPVMRAGIPTCPERDLPDDVEKAAALVAGAAPRKGSGPAFFWARSILKRPSWYLQLNAILAQKYPEACVETVDPYTFFGLIRMNCEESGAERRK